MACSTCGSKTSGLQVEEKPSMNKSALMKLASDIVSQMPEDITYTEVRQVSAMVQAAYPPPPPTPTVPQGQTTKG